MTRQTSIDVYHRIKAEGLLSKRRWEVYDCLFHRGPLTQREVCKKIATEKITERSYTPRFAELLESTVIEIVGQTTCSLSGEEVYLWDVTRNVPKKIERNVAPTKNELIQALCKQLDQVLEASYKKEQNETWTKWREISEAVIKQCEKYRKKK